MPLLLHPLTPPYNPACRRKAIQYLNTRSHPLVLTAIMALRTGRSSEPFKFSSRYNYPPFWSIQPTFATRQVQLQIWSSLIQSYCRYNHIWRITLVDALNTPLFHNAQLRKRLTLLEAREIIDWMTREEGAQRAEWIGKEAEKGSAWIYWRRPEEWAEALSNWVRHRTRLLLC